MSEIKFGVFSDLHYDHIPDGDKRIQYFIEQVNEEDLDFIIELGDFSYPIDDNLILLENIRKLNVPLYCVIGNHDTDIYERKLVMDFLDLKDSYYSFRTGDLKFIVLDSCFVKTINGFKPYSKSNYDKITESYPYVPDFEIEWLEKELEDDSKHYIIFSHHSLENNFRERGICNRKEIQSLIEKVNESNKRVLLCMNGHDHGWAVKKIGKTFNYSLNAMSYIWVGPQYEHFSYSQEIHKKYPYLKDLVLYKQGLFAIVTISDNGDIKIKGMNGDYQNVSPHELGLGDTWNGRSIQPIVPSFSAKYEIY